MMPARPVSEFICFIPKPTSQLLQLLEAHQGKLPASMFAEVIQDIESLFHKYSAALADSPPGVDRAELLHHLMNQIQDGLPALPITCSKGCAGCCHAEVEITEDEAMGLLQIVQSGLLIDRPRLETQASRERQSPEWARFFSPENRCVFLGPDDSCRIYAHRPAACRKLLVTSHPSACTTAGAPVEPVGILLAEILLSAAISLENTRFGSISKMLSPLLPPAPSVSA